MSYSAEIAATKNGKMWEKRQKQFEGAFKKEKQLGHGWGAGEIWTWCTMHWNNKKKTLKEKWTNSANNTQWEWDLCYNE